jgi:hypothetical protein
MRMPQPSSTTHEQQRPGTQQPQSSKNGEAAALAVTEEETHACACCMRQYHVSCHTPKSHCLSTPSPTLNNTTPRMQLHGVLLYHICPEVTDAISKCTRGDCARVRLRLHPHLLLPHEKIRMQQASMSTLLGQLCRCWRCSRQMVALPVARRRHLQKNSAVASGS